MNRCKDVTFVHDAVDAFFHDDLDFTHFLECKKLLILLMLDFPNLIEIILFQIPLSR